MRLTRWSKFLDVCQGQFWSSLLCGGGQCAPHIPTPTRSRSATWSLSTSGTKTIHRVRCCGYHDVSIPRATFPCPHPVVPPPTSQQLPPQQNHQVQIGSISYNHVKTESNPQIALFLQIAPFFKLVLKRAVQSCSSRPYLSCSRQSSWTCRDLTSR